MLLDAVLDDRDMVWLGAESDKTRYFPTRRSEDRFQPMRARFRAPRGVRLGAAAPRPGARRQARR